MRLAPLTLGLALLAACSQRLLTDLPVGDGYGPAGGVGTSNPAPDSGGSSAPPPAPSGSSSGSSSGTSPPTQDAGENDDAPGSPVTGNDAGAPGSASDASGGASHDSMPPVDSGSIADLLAQCVSQVNAVRSQNGVPPYAESADLESYAAQAVASDAHNGQKHSYFYATGGGGVAATEDELDGDQVAPGASAAQTLQQGIDADVQGQGQALANLVSDQLSEVGCGFAQDPAGNWWIDVALR